MEPSIYWEDFETGQTRTYGPIEVTREAIIAFASQFDPQPFHLDDAAAAQSLFGRLAASGWHTCALTMRMLCDAYLLRSASLGSPGIENLRWLQPVYAGDTLHGTLQVLECRASESRPGMGLVRSRWNTLNQHEQPVLTMEGWGMFRRRGPTRDTP
jgi:acyl dehydratase